ncbi:uncharacterized protein L3040_006278 [Drepanopeziza brunnea f. sp. 'multigermtubi']|uniref:Nicotinamide riboside kinase 1 n=1 Tax=Marssonina brunnea f. sp. multigermtubi (strain MB_m1) TaxID=1072389 RepID=K1X7Z5_MARBU|nr:nicotinamide riboside kinase 1 [Drepanopeziza brunnea f. sp. 'multigermtubi' MB_m1]EKD16778.1 nicotinamide riboside kinase 1 [Drepanopeziza brunnea f. sp. 'multigermtubi' MB_m1]KAJ5040629.1 hypothetical protein L3040_006278 [Drepanopeziza brunnea f. sp. 'multigermtubi']
MSSQMEAQSERVSSLSTTDNPRGQPNSPDSNVVLVHENAIPEPHRSEVSCIISNRPSSFVELFDPTKDKTFVVAIGGCTSSGKSSLALILSEVFTNPPATADSFGPLGEIDLNMKNAGTLGQDGSFKLEHIEEIEGAKAAASIEKKATVVSQDDFLLDKKIQLKCSFTNAQSLTDTLFVQNSMKNHSGLYAVNDSTRAPVPGHLLDSDVKAGEQGSTSSASTLPSTGNEGGGYPVLEVSGPNSDVDFSIDFAGLVSTILEIKETGKPNNYLKRFSSEVDLEDCTALIAKLREKVAGFAKEQAILNAEARFGGYFIKGPIENEGIGNGKASLRPGFAFVEGFLLFASPDAVDEEGPFDFNVEAEKVKVSSYTDRICSYLRDLKKGHTVDTAEQIEAAREVIEAQLATTLRRAKHYMQGLFDLKLFLSVSEPTAKNRRMHRPMYIDAPAGERIPGQMWRSEGYFDQIAWPSFAQTHRWLLDNREIRGFLEEDISIQPVVDATTKETAEWAVSTILSKLGCLEQRNRDEARYDHCEEYGNDC